MCGEEITVIDVRDLQVSLYGRDRKSVRLNCTNPASKIHLIKQARRKKPGGIFVNEFLTSATLQLYRNLRQLKALHPHKIKSVFTRNGNVLYTLNDSNRVIRVSSLTDLNNIIGPGPAPETPVVNPSADSSENSSDN